MSRRLGCGERRRTRDEGVVPSPVPVSVEESASPRELVWITSVTGVAAGIFTLLLVWVGKSRDILDVIAHPLEWRKVSVAVRVAVKVFWWDCSAIWMASSSCVVYSQE